MKPVCLHTPIPPIEKIQNPSWDMLTCGCQVPIRKDRHMYETQPDSDAVLAQFNRLIMELLRGNMRRNTFRRGRWNCCSISKAAVCANPPNGRRSSATRRPCKD